LVLCRQKGKKAKFVMEEEDFIIKDNVDQFGKLPKNVLQQKKMLASVEKKLLEQR